VKAFNRLAGSKMISYIFFCFIAMIGINSGCTKEGPAGPPGPINDNDLMDPAILPRVISTSPLDGSTGPYNLFDPGDGSAKAYFIVQFNKLIYTADLWSNYSAFTVRGFNRPVVVRLFPEYRYPVKNRTIQNGPYDNVLSFVIYDSAAYYGMIRYEIGKIYSVAVDTSLKDINNNHLTHPYIFSFIPEPYFRAAGIYPRNNSIDVYRDASISIAFNSPIDQNMLSSIHITPLISGRWQISIYDSLTAVFSHLEPFDYNTAYTITIDGNAHDAAGHIIRSGVSSTFKSSQFKVTSYYPSPNSTVNNLNSSIEISLSYPADTASMRRAFSVLPNTYGYLYLTSTGLSYYPIDGLIPNARYTVTLSTELMSSDSIHLSAPFSFSFTTGKFRITDSYPYDGSTGNSRYSTTYIYFNGKIDTGSVRTAMHISPNVPVSLSMSEQSCFFYPVSPYSAMTVYTVTVDSTVRSKTGYTMSAPYAFSFKTGE